MRNRTEPNTVEKAVRCIDGFQKVYQSLQQQVALRGQSSSTLNNYIHRTALVALHFGKLPELVSDDEINEYLCSLALSAKSPSRSSFKHAVYGLRYYFRLIGAQPQPSEGYDFYTLLPLRFIAYGNGFSQ
jgi:integrase/recombinase XerD